MTRDYRGAHVDASDLIGLSRRLKGVAAGKEIRLEVGKANRAVVAVVAEEARRQASAVGPQAAKVAESDAFDAKGTPDRASLALMRTKRGGFGEDDGHNPRRFAFGTEFGAKQNKPRETGVKRTRLARGVYVTDASQAKTRLGWNQFKPWRGNSRVSVGDGIQPGYWMYPALREKAGEVAAIYGARAKEIVSKALRAGLLGG